MPAWEKSRSTGADVAGMLKYFMASEYKQGYLLMLAAQNSDALIFKIGNNIKLR